jgi:hypothetical protein
MGAGGQFGAVGVAMEHREGRHDQCRQPQRRPELKEHHQPDHQSGEGNAHLHAGERHP